MLRGPALSSPPRTSGQGRAGSLRPQLVLSPPPCPLLGRHSGVTPGIPSLSQPRRRAVHTDTPPCLLLGGARGPGAAPWHAGRARPVPGVRPEAGGAGAGGGGRAAEGGGGGRPGGKLEGSALGEGLWLSSRSARRGGLAQTCFSRAGGVGRWPSRSAAPQDLAEALTAPPSAQGAFRAQPAPHSSGMAGGREGLRDTSSSVQQTCL